MRTHHNLERSDQIVHAPVQRLVPKLLELRIALHALRYKYM